MGDSVGNDAKLGRLVGTGVGIEVGFVVVGRVVGDYVVGESVELSLAMPIDRALYFTACGPVPCKYVPVLK